MVVTSRPLQDPGNREENSKDDQHEQRNPASILHGMEQNRSPSLVAGRTKYETDRYEERNQIPQFVERKGQGRFEWAVIHCGKMD